MKNITELGSIFFKCKDARKMNEWYAKNLGLATDDYGASFEWRQADEPEKKAFRYGHRSRRILPTLNHPSKIL
ncbi:MAG: hypothetical protein JWP44_1633 [Mucilaginibacter sp.]|nr:hypothetical protein [Mucilaginibacter sp.]